MPRVRQAKIAKSERLPCMVQLEEQEKNLVQLNQLLHQQLPQTPPGLIREADKSEMSEMPHITPPMLGTPSKSSPESQAGWGQSVWGVVVGWMIYHTINTPNTLKTRLFPFAVAILHHFAGARYLIINRPWFDARMREHRVHAWGKRIFLNVGNLHVKADFLTHEKKDKPCHPYFFKNSFLAYLSFFYIYVVIYMQHLYIYIYYLHMHICCNTYSLLRCLKNNSLLDVFRTISCSNH